MHALCCTICLACSHADRELTGYSIYFSYQFDVAKNTMCRLAPRIRNQKYLLYNDLGISSLLSPPIRLLMHKAHGFE
jgi:hypothetical protein